MKDDLRSDLLRNGFTLLEVLLAVAIFSVIVAALYSTFFLSHRAVEAVDDSLLRLQESRAVIDTIKRELESALYRDNDKEHTVFKLADRDFYGRQASQIVFTCFSPLMNGLAKVSYEIEERDGTLSLKKKIASAFSKSAETKPLELIEDVESFTIEVKYNDKWVKTWDSALANERIPDEIRITLKIQPKKQGAGGEKSSSRVVTVSDVARPKIERTL